MCITSQDLRTKTSHKGVSVEQVVTSLDDSTRIGLVSVGTATAVFDLSGQQGAAVSALALPGDRPLSGPLLAVLEKGMPSHVVPLARCRARTEAAIASLRCICAFDSSLCIWALCACARE